MIQDLRLRVDIHNVQDQFKSILEPSELQRREKLSEVAKLDKEIKELKYVLLKRINIKK